MRIMTAAAAACALISTAAQAADGADLARRKAEEAAVTITRDDWGIAHVHGHTDAQAVFGMVYAQAEDDFNRVETNYLNALGRLAETEGEAAIWSDLRQRLFIDPAVLKADYASSPAWLRALMDAWADGLNAYLADHPAVKPRVITRFEPWMALSFSEGSIGGDIERVSLPDLQAFYDRTSQAALLLPCDDRAIAHDLPSPSMGEGPRMGVSARRLRRGSGGASRAFCVNRSANAPTPAPPPSRGRDSARYAGDNSACESGGEKTLADLDDDETSFKEPGGSNGIAIAPSNTAASHALLLINPHTSFYFRSELQVTSDQGLDAYGAATWGQVFIYQGFNRHIGWMHTSTGADAVDEFAETIVNRDGRLFYRYGAEERPVVASEVIVPYRTGAGSMASRTFTVYRTSHGPVVRAAGDRWISLALMNTPVAALSQSYLRTKAHDYASFLKVAQTYRANSSNNTVFADDRGEIAFLMPQFIPRRDDRFDYTAPVDGADPATDWHGLTPFDQTPHLLNPANGWIMNTNDWPYSAASDLSPRREAYPRFMDTAGENPRGLHATELLTGRRGWTLESLNRAAFDPHLPAFAKLIPVLATAYDKIPASDPLKARLKDQVAALRAWDDRWSLDSVPTSLAVFWGEALWADSAPQAKAAKVSVYDWMANRTSPSQKLSALVTASDRLARDFGTWRTPWGEINRYQRLDDAIAPHFDDVKPSLPVAFTSAQWGSLASFGAHRYPNTKRYYGSSGNSFVTAVEFGPKVRAVAVTAGGESGHPGSAHFTDEAERYRTGQLRPVYFYPSDLIGHVSRRYHPGEAPAVPDGVSR